MSRPAHTYSPSHFGEWLQGRLGPEGPVVLITLACPLPAVRVGQGTAVPQSAAFCAQLGIADPGKRVTAMFQPGAGCGTSTASLLAIAGQHDPEQLAKACVAVERATDPLMWPQPDSLLWAPRRGKIVARMRRPPAYDILGGFYGAPSPTDPDDQDFPDIADLIVRYENGAALVPIATESALRTTALRGPTTDPTAALAQRLGALGHTRAHTGSARALVFPVGAIPQGAKKALRDAGLSDPVQFQTGYPA